MPETVSLNLMQTSSSIKAWSVSLSHAPSSDLSTPGQSDDNMDVVAIDCPLSERVRSATNSRNNEAYISAKIIY